MSEFNSNSRAKMYAEMERLSAADRKRRELEDLVNYRNRVMEVCLVLECANVRFDIDKVLCSGHELRFMAFHGRPSLTFAEAKSSMNLWNDMFAWMGTERALP